MVIGRENECPKRIMHQMHKNPHSISLMKHHAKSIKFHHEYSERGRSKMVAKFLSRAGVPTHLLVCTTHQQRVLDELFASIETSNRNCVVRRRSHFHRQSKNHRHILDQMTALLKSDK